MSLLPLFSPLWPSAGTTFDFYGYASPGFDGYGILVKGTFDATPGFGGSPSIWSVTSVTGSVTIPGQAPVAITGLVADPGNAITTAHGFIYDNLFYSAIPAGFNYGTYPYAMADGFDFWGILFGTSDGNYVNLFTNVGGPVYATDTYAYTNTAYFGYLDPTAAPSPAFVVTATPEPSSLILLGTGALTAAFGIRRKMARG